MRDYGEFTPKCLITIISNIVAFVTLGISGLIFIFAGFRNFIQTLDGTYFLIVLIGGIFIGVYCIITYSMLVEMDDFNDWVTKKLNTRKDTKNE